MKRKLNLIFLLLGMLSLLFLNGCSIGRLKYNVKIIENYELLDNFLDEHKTSESYNYDSVKNEYSLNNPSLPEEYIFVIKTEDDYRKIFKSSSNINFKKEMLILYIYSSIYTGERRITEVELDEGELSIDFRHKVKVGTGLSSKPLQKHIVFKMNAVDFYEIEVDVD